jgi:hypothetical protein
VSFVFTPHFRFPPAMRAWSHAVFFAFFVKNLVSFVVKLFSASFAISALKPWVGSQRGSVGK